MAVFTLDIILFLRDGTVSADIIHQFGRRLNLLYLSETEIEGRVCLAANADLRPEYRDTFTINHVRDYIYTILCTDSKNLKRDKVYIPYPSNTDSFWKLAEQGNRMR